MVFTRFNYKPNIARFCFYVVVFCCVAGLSYLGARSYFYQQAQIKIYDQQIAEAKYLEDSINLNQGLIKMIYQAQNSYPFITVVPEQESANDMKDELRGKNFAAATKLYLSIVKELNIKIADARQKGQLSGNVISQGAAIAEADVAILQNNLVLSNLKSNETGMFEIWLLNGKYSIQISKTGYNTLTQEIEIIATQKSENSFELTKKVAVVSKPKVAAVQTSTDEGNYRKITVSTERGSFTVHLMTFEMSAYRMIVDTAADWDCENDCPVKSLEEYAAQNAAVAGIHGTYFCPTSYPSCAGKTNSFYFKIFNGRVAKKINWNNGLGDYLPFLLVTGSGEAKYYDSWDNAKNADMETGISCRPHLVENGQVVLTTADLDSEKESAYKITHGFIGLKGQTIYAGVVLSSTLYDSAAVSKALGLDNSFNLDGGGTTAMFYNGKYKIGPGRAMPNAILFIKR